MHELSKHGTKGSAGHDDWAFGAKRAAGTNRNSRRKRLQKCQAWRNSAALNEDGLNRLGNAMAANALRTIACHESYDESAHDGYENYQCAEVVASRRYQVHSPPLEEKKICEQTDESQ